MQIVPSVSNKCVIGRITDLHPWNGGSYLEDSHCVTSSICRSTNNSTAQNFVKVKAQPSSVQTSMKIYARNWQSFFNEQSITRRAAKPVTEKMLMEVLKSKTANPKTVEQLCEDAITSISGQYRSMIDSPLHTEQLALLSTVCLF